MATLSTLRHIAYDVLRSLNQNYSDAEINLPQVIYWIMIHADRLKKVYMEMMDFDSGAYVNSFPIVVLVDPLNGRNYFGLPVSIYDYREERGIEFITYRPELDPNNPVFTSVQFTRTTIPATRRLYMRDDEKPTPANPYFYRLADRIYLLGVEQINLLEIEAGLRTSFEPVDSLLDIDEPFDFPQELIPQLKKEILAMGLFVIKTPQEFNIEVMENALQVITPKDIPA